jgi:hypothetical protein
LTHTSLLLVCPHYDFTNDRPVYAPYNDLVDTTATSLLPLLYMLYTLHTYTAFSPLNLCTRGPYGSREDNFRHYRGVEVKHGRIAMAACLGMLTQENYRFEGFLSPSANLEFNEVPNGLRALDVVPLEGWVQMAVVIGMHELIVKQRPGKAPYVFIITTTV